MDSKVLKWVSLGVSAAAAVLGVVSNVIGEKQRDETIKKEVAKAIAKAKE